MKNKKKYQKKKQVYNFEAVHPPDSADLLRERERRLKDLEQLTLLSDVFMSVVLSDLKACQHVVRILIGNPGITLVSVKTQYVISKVTSHGARLDVLAEDADKTLYHLEIEGADVTDHARRTRFYGSLTDGEILRKGKTTVNCRRDTFSTSAEKISGKAAVLFTRKKSDSRRADSRIRTVPILSM